MTTFWQAATRRQIVLTAIRVSLVVGSVLNLINQGTKIAAGADIAWAQVVLNYLVPYCAATYSAAKNDRERSKSA